MARSSLSRGELSLLIVEEALRQDVAPELALAVARVESNFNANARSHAGARGVMQIMPATALGEFGVQAHRLYEPELNIRIGIQYLRQLLDRYDQDEALALSHYNGGSRVRRSDGSLAVIPYTRSYVNNVLAQKHRYASHSLVLAARNGELGQRRWRLAAADLDDFGGSSQSGFLSQRPVALARPVGSGQDAERSRLVRALQSLKFKNQRRALGRSARPVPAAMLDDF
ncbi:MAG: lytic transglycosylase domain-containing protein [Pseudomonadota bacterium]|nr:lytic transglycosylase domain-containing protein [Pseudomonadota bacterium]